MRLSRGQQRRRRRECRAAARGGDAPVIPLSDKWRVRDDGDEWCLQKLVKGATGPSWRAMSFWTYRAWLLRGIAEAEIPANEGGLAQIQALPPAHPSRGLPSGFDADAFVRGVEEGRQGPRQSIAGPRPPTDVVGTVDGYRRQRAARIAEHSLPGPLPAVAR